MTPAQLDQFLDSLLEADAAAQRSRRVAELGADLRKVGTTCGDCALWMTRACPKETNVNGWNRGPSCATPKCGTFSEAASAEGRRSRLRVEIEGLGGQGDAA